MTATNPRRIHIGNRNFNPSQWTDFGWDDPRHGPQIKGEVAVIRDDGTSGSLAAGLWRTGHDPRRVSARLRCAGLGRRLFAGDDQRGVLPAEAERVDLQHIDRPFRRRLDHHVQPIHFRH